MNSAVVVRFLAAVWLAVACCSQAGATDFMASGAAACDGADWFAQRSLYRTPTGISNSGQRSVMVTCSVPTIAAAIPPNNEFQVLNVRVDVYNGSGKEDEMSCLLTTPNGWDVEVRKSILLAAGQPGVLRFNPDQYRANHSTFAMSCILPSKFEVRTVSGTVSEWEFQPMEARRRPSR